MAKQWLRTCRLIIGTESGESEALDFSQFRINYTVIGEVRGGKKTYGSMEEVLTVMGKEARSIGADAVINLKTRRDIGAWAWSRPVGNGDGIKLSNKADFDCFKLGGEFR